jgi:predicted PurR-regulated permease PerM
MLYNKYHFLWKTGLVIGIFLLLAWLFSSIFWYLLISLIVSALLAPVVNNISEVHILRVKIPRGIAILIALALLGLAVFSFISLFVPLVSEQISVVKTIDFKNIPSHLSQPIAKTELFLIRNFQLKEQVGFLSNKVSDGVVHIVENIDVGSILNNIFSLAGSTFVAILGVGFFTFYLLYERGLVRNKIIDVIPNQYFEIMATALHKIEHLLSNYLRGILIESLAVGFLLWFGLSLVETPYSLNIAVFAAFINFIPYLGPLISTSFALLVTVSSSFIMGDGEIGSWVLKVVLVFLSVRLIDDVFLQPFIFSKSVKVHPLEIFVAVFAGASLAGAIGMILAVPTYTVIRVIYKEMSIGYRQYRVFR